MVEMRWRVASDQPQFDEAGDFRGYADSAPVLEYRARLVEIDGDRHIVRSDAWEDRWSEWMIVPTVHDD